MKTPEREWERKRETERDSAKKRRRRLEGGGLHMATDYDWWRNTGERGGGHEAITLQRAG